MSKQSETNANARVSAYIKYVVVALLLGAAAWPILKPPTPSMPAVRSTVRGPTIGETTNGEAEQKIATRVEELWNEFVNQHPEKVRKAFRPGATEEEILEVENTFGMRLPPDYRAFLKLCNGTHYEYGMVYPPPFSTQQLVWGSSTQNQMFGDFDTPRILKIDSSNGKTTVEVGEILWYPSLIVIADMDGFGLVLELESGKIIWWDHDGWSFSYCADSFTQLLEKSIERTRKSGGRPTWETL